MLSLTLGFGIWQLQRLAWKQGLLAAIDRGETSPPVPLEADVQQFRRVLVTGRFRPETAQYGIELQSVAGTGAQMGAHVLSVLQRSAGPPVIVDRGWAPLDTNIPAPHDEVNVEGYVRFPDQPVWFGPKDDLAARRFYTLDPTTIGAVLGYPGVAPFVIVALGPRGMLQPASALPRPPNDHLSYALTWFGLSTALLAVFGLYARQVFRNGDQR